MGWGSMTGTKSTARRKSMSEMGRSFVRTFASRSPEPQSQEEKPTSPSAKRRGSFIGRTLQTFRNPSPEPGAPLASGKGRRKSREDNSDEKSGAVYCGDKCVVLYDYFAESSAPFPPDTRRELTVTKGARLDILETRPDGWCLVRKPRGATEYWLPGNHLSTNGQTPYVSTDG